MIKNLKKAFTIIELVIVIAVIAILAAVMIPTYSSLVKKANLSADEQAVKQMNTALAIYTAENGKPSNGGEVKLGLSENDINADTLVPVTQGYAFYWNPTDNKIVLVGEGKATAKEGWVLLTSTGYGELKTVSTAEEINDIIDASSTSKPALIKLENHIDVSSETKPVKTTGYALKKDGSDNNFDVVYSVASGESVILDLNGKTLTDESNYCTFAVCPGGTLIIKNGTIECKTNPRAINTEGGTISLDHVTIKTSIKNYDGNKYAVKVDALADVSIMNSTIINDWGFALTSNSDKDEYDGARISIINSTLISNKTSCAGIFLGTYVNLTIDNCEISGVDQGLYLRGLNATIKNSKIYNTGKDGEINNTDNQWSSGNNGFTADIVFACGGTTEFDGYITTGNYICENVTGNPNSSAENPGFTVIVHQPNGGKVNVIGDIIPNKTFTKTEISAEIWDSTNN